MTMPPESVAPPARRRRWLRLSLRGLMVLVLVAGGGVGWLAYTIRTQRAAIRAVTAAGGRVVDDYWTDVPLPGDSWITRGRRTGQRWITAAVGFDLFRSVIEVKFAGPVAGDVLAHLDRFRKLEALELEDVTLIGAGWWHLQGREHLRALDLTGPGLDDTALVAVAQIRGLRTLALSEAKADDPGFVALASLPALDELSLRFCPNLTEEGATRLVAGLPALRSLSVGTLDSRAVTALLTALPEHHPDLETLDVGGVTLSPAGLAAIARLPRLTVLRLEGLALGDRGLEALGTLPSVQHLVLYGAGVGDEGLTLLARLPALRSLVLAGPEISDTGLATLESLPLNQLTLKQLPTVTDAAMTSIARNQTIKSLTLNLRQLTDAGLASLRGMTQLRELTLLNTAVTPAGIAPFQATPSLAVVSPMVPVVAPTSTSLPNFFDAGTNP